MLEQQDERCDNLFGRFVQLDMFNLVYAHVIDTDIAIDRLSIAHRAKYNGYDKF